MKLKKFIAAFMVCTMVATMVAGCGSGGDSSSDSSGDSPGTVSEDDQATENSTGVNGEIEEIVFATPIVATIDMSQLEDELNKITEEKIGVRVKIEGIASNIYANQIGLMMSGNEQLDVMGYLGTYSSMLSKNQFLCMDDYIDDYASETKEVLGEEFLKSTSKNGSIYALPTNNGKAAVINILLRADLIAELNLPVDQLIKAKNFEEYCQNLDLLTDMFAQIHTAYPELVCLVPPLLSPNTLLFTEYMPFADLLNDSYGVIMDGADNTVTNLYATEEYKKLLEYAYKWNQSGYILNDATTTQESAKTYLQNGRTAGYFIRGEEGMAEQVITATGIDVESIKLVEGFINTSDINDIGFAISATSQKPEAAMKFLNELYTNADVINLLDWGIEGIHYEIQEDGTVDFPEGVSADNTTYGLNMDWFFGNQFLSYIWGKGRDTTVQARVEANNKSARFSPLIGFSYDSTGVSTELAALDNVKNQYLPGLVCGALNPDTELPKFLAALEDAGIQTVIDEKLAQIDEFLANQGE